MRAGIGQHSRFRSGLRAETVGNVTVPVSGKRRSKGSGNGGYREEDERQRWGRAGDGVRRTEEHTEDGGALMSGQWKEVVRLAFKGQRFRDHALDLSAIAELSQFQKMVVETAKALWHAANPDRERLPKRFEERTRLCLRKIEEGSAVAPLEVYIEEPGKLELFEPEPTEINTAIRLTHQVFRAVERDEPLPENFPKALVPEFERWGQGLADDEAIEIITPETEPARVTLILRSRLAAFVERVYEGHVDVIGEVLEADVRQGHFQVWPDDETCVAVTFSTEQEAQVTNALREHRTLRLQVIGRGEFSPQGKALRVKHVEALRLRPTEEVSYDTTARPIEDVLAELAREIPENEWEKLPPDLTDNLDHYLYGRPKH